MTEQELNEVVEQAAQVIVGSKYVIALVGAGLSVESGIPPFRGPGGLWTKFGEPDMRGYERFLEDPKGWWEERQRPDERFGDFREALEQAKPNPGHYALAELEEMGVLKCIITQNVDNLHQAAGSKNVAEIHGNMYKLRCINCNFRCDNGALPLDTLPPRCPQCGGIVKSDGVMFGEPIPSDVLAWCNDEALRTDCILSIGTSAQVYPAAGFPIMAKRAGAHLVEINPYETAISLICDVVVRAPSGEVLPRIVKRVRELREEQG